MTAYVEPDCTIPLRECEPWCDDGDGHPNVHPEDRACMSAWSVMAQSLGKPQLMANDEWWRPRLTIFCNRFPEDPTHGYVHVQDDTNEHVLKLTAAEARALAKHLIEAATALEAGTS